MAEGGPFPIIRGLVPNSMNEWHGRLAAAVFLQGCNWRCPFCHGWRFVTEPDSLPPIPVDALDDLLSGEAGWIDGVVVSGGEPTLQPHLENLVRLIRRHGAAVKLHTNGSRPDVVRGLLERNLLECLALDFKAPLTAERLTRSAGTQVDLEAVRQSVRLGPTHGVECEFHTTLCPACLDLDDLRAMAETLRTEAPQARWIWQQYNPGDVLDPGRAGETQFALPDIASVADELRATGLEIEVRGY